MAAYLNAYLKMLQRAPLLTKSVTGGALFAIGDTVNQCLHPLNAYDIKGAVSFAAFGALWYAPTNHFWFAWMERNIASGASWSHKPMMQAFTRVILHSAVYAPFSIVSLFVWSGTFSGQEISGILDMIAPQAMSQIWLAGSFFWIPIMLGIYRFVPYQMRVLATSLANVFWTGYLSYKKTLSLQGRKQVPSSITKTANIFSKNSSRGGVSK